MKLHHATVKRAERLGVTFANTNDGGFRLTNADGLLSTETWDSAKEALDEMEAGRVEFEAPRNKRLYSGVMPIGHHDRYEHNPHGPGCNDGLDMALRDTFTTTAGVDTTALKALGESVGLWNPEWELRNPGMQRMNLSNRIRAWLRNDMNAKLTIGQDTGRFGVPYQPRKSKARKAA